MTGLVTGVVLNSAGHPLAGACVTAVRQASAASPVGPAVASSPVTGRTSPSGRYLLAGLPTGAYILHFRGCARASGASAEASRQIVVSGGQLATAAPVTLPPAPSSGAMRSVVSPDLAPAFVQPRGRRAEPRRFTAAELRRLAPGARYGGIAGRVTDTAGRPIKGICVNANFSGFAVGISTAASGHYRLRFLPPGRTTVQFTPTCGFGGKGAGNWAPVWYRGKYSQANANKVTIRAGKITWGIDAVMRRGGQITGVVTGKGGARLSHVCVDLMSANGKQFVTEVKTARGRYRIDALDTGRYRVFFDPACGFRATPYLGQWWQGASTFKASRVVTVRLGATTAHVNAALRLGGSITGVVRAAGPDGKPIAGMCVSATVAGPGGVFSGPSSFTRSRRNGSYVMEGLPSGRYTLLVNPGCNNNGNWLNYSSPRPFRVRLGQATVINVFLRPGAIVTGTVTSAATGLPLSGICVSVNDFNGDGTSTTKNGTFFLDQIQPGRYAVNFSGGCGNKGSYAPQWYPGRTESFNAARVAFTGGKITSGIDAVMRPGSAVSGTVTTKTGAPLRGICVGVFTPGVAGNFDGFGFANGQTRRDGSYHVQNLAPGQYQVMFFSCYSFTPRPGWAMQWYRSKRTPGDAGLLDVPAATTVTGIDAALNRGGAISGTARAPSGNADSFICITATNRKSGVSAATEADSFPSGLTVPYTFSGLAPGRYTVEFQDCGGGGAATQWYRDQSTPRAANPVTVTAGHITRRIDARLVRAPGGGSISGRVTAQATGRPVPGICVSAFSADSFAFGSGRTDSRGDYTIRHLTSGRYQMFFGSCRGHRYADQARPGVVVVRAPHAVRGVDFAVSLAGSISGTVLGGQPAHAPLRGVCVTAIPISRGASFGFGVTGRGGRYLLGDLSPGTYQVSFDDISCSDDSEPFADQWYNSQPSQASATPVTVLPGAATTGIGATLLHDGTISGTVTSAAASAPLTGICVEAAPFGGSARPQVYAVSSAGSYRLTGLPPGQYLVIFSSGCGATGYARQYWQDATSPAAATVITVAPGSLTPGIDAAMQP